MITNNDDISNDSNGNNGNNNNIDNEMCQCQKKKQVDNDGNKTRFEKRRKISAGKDKGKHSHFSC